MRKPIKILYFAWLRDSIGIKQEEMPLPDGIGTVEELVSYLSAHGPRHAAAFKNLLIVRCAINQEFAEFSSPVQAGDEVAFFPPMTGG